MNRKLENRLKRKVRSLLENMIKENEQIPISFKGRLTFVDNPNINDRYLERNYWGDIGGDLGDISDFKIYDDGIFSGYLSSYASGKRTKDDFINLVYDILLNHDSNTYNFIDTIDKVTVNGIPQTEHYRRLKEEGPMPPPADDFKTLPIVAKEPVKVATDTTVSVDRKFVTIDRAGNEVTLSRNSAIKVANYLIRVLGKV